MTTDYVQKKELSSRLRFLLLPKALRKDKNGHRKTPVFRGDMELTRQQSFVDGLQDIFDLLEKNEPNKDGLKRTVSSTMAILNNAQLMIERAEQKIARQNARIRELEYYSTVDKMTGLLNRRGFFQAFNRELNRVERKLSKGGLLVMIEVDSYTSIARSYGQEAGTRCLKLAGRTLKNEIRPMDAAARLSGDEFVLLLADAGKKEALERAQRLALRMNNLSFIHEGKELAVNASLGLKSFGSGDKAEDIFTQADKDLQSEKNKKKENKM